MLQKKEGGLPIIENLWKWQKNQVILMEANRDWKWLWNHKNMDKH